MAKENIEINVKSYNGYDKIYPRTTSINVDYDNTRSGVSATNIQDAFDVAWVSIYNSMLNCFPLTSGSRDIIIPINGLYSIFCVGGGQNGLSNAGGMSGQVIYCERKLFKKNELISLGISASSVTVTYKQKQLSASYGVAAPSVDPVFNNFIGYGSGANDGLNGGHVQFCPSWLWWSNNPSVTGNNYRGGSGVGGGLGACSGSGLVPQNGGGISAASNVTAGAGYGGGGGSYSGKIVEGGKPAIFMKLDQIILPQNE